MGKPENAVEQHLRKLVEAAGGRCFKFTSAINGVPDRIVVLNGHTIFVELKAPNGGQPRPLQRVRHDQIRSAGGDVRVLNSRVGVEAFVTSLLSS